MQGIKFADNTTVIGQFITRLKDSFIRLSNSGFLALKLVTRTLYSHHTDTWMSLHPYTIFTYCLQPVYIFANIYLITTCLYLYTSQYIVIFMCISVYNLFSLHIYIYYITAQPVYITIHTFYHYCIPFYHSNIFYFMVYFSIILYFNPIF